MGKNYCRFVSISEKIGVYDSFFIEDGGTIFINGDEKTVKYNDSYHFQVGFNFYHISEFFEKVVLGAGSVVIPGKGLKTKEYGKNYFPYKENTYSIVTFPDLGDMKFEFSDFRIIRETLPLGMYAYDIRHDDESQGIACEIANKILVNYLGTILTKEPLLERDNERILLNNDMRFH